MFYFSTCIISRWKKRHRRNLNQTAANKNKTGIRFIYYMVLIIGGSIFQLKQNVFGCISNVSLFYVEEGYFEITINISSVELDVSQQHDHQYSHLPCIWKNIY